MYRCYFTHCTRLFPWTLSLCSSLAFLYFCVCALCHVVCIIKSWQKHWVSCSVLCAALCTCCPSSSKITTTLDCMIFLLQVLPKGACSLPMCLPATPSSFRIHSRSCVAAGLLFKRLRAFHQARLKDEDLWLNRARWKVPRNLPSDICKACASLALRGGLSRARPKSRIVRFTMVLYVFPHCKRNDCLHIFVLEHSGC